MNKNKKTVQIKKTEKPAQSLNPEISEYNGKPMLVLNPDAQFKFQFGLGKAKMIVSAYESIKAFAESEGESLD